MTKIHDKVITESNKPSLKKAKAEVKKATLVLTSNQSKLVDESVSLIERVFNEDNGYTITRGKLIGLIAEKFAEIVGLNPSFELWNLSKNSIMNPILSARGIDEKSFNSNIWDSVTTYCDKKFQLVKPKSKGADAERQAKSRAEKEKRQAEIDKMSIADLEKAGMFVEIGKRKENEIKAKADAELAKYDGMRKAILDFVKVATPKEVLLFNTITKNPEPFAKLAESLGTK
jgi:hypothetical protein